MVDRNSRTPAGIEDVTAIEGRQVVRITGGGANRYGDMYSDDAVIADTDDMTGNNTGGAAARSTRISHRGPDSTTPGTHNNTSGGGDGGDRRMNTASQNNRVWNSFDALFDDDEEDEREGARDEYGTRGNTRSTNGTGTNNNTGRGSGGEGDGGGHTIAAPRSNRSTTISTSGGTTDPPAVNTPRNNMIVPTQFATTVPPTPAADPAAAGLVASSPSSSDRTTSGGPRGTGKDGAPRNNTTTVVVADKKSSHSSDGSSDTQGEKCNTVIAVLHNRHDFPIQTQKKIVQCAGRLLCDVAAIVLDPGASEQISNEAMATICNGILKSSSPFGDPRIGQCVQQFHDDVCDDIRDMIINVLTVEEGYDEGDWNQDPTVNQAATLFRFFPELIATLKATSNQYSLQFGDDWKRHLERLQRPPLPKPLNLMDLPTALLARPLGYLDTQSVMIVSTINKQYRDVVRDSEMEEGMFRSQIYLSATKAELRNAKKELTEAEDAIAERNHRIIELLAVYTDAIAEVRTALTTEIIAVISGLVEEKFTEAEKVAVLEKRVEQSNAEFAESRAEIADKDRRIGELEAVIDKQKIGS